MSLIQGIDPDSLLQGGWPLALGWLKSSHLNTDLLRALSYYYYND